MTDDADTPADDAVAEDAAPEQAAAPDEETATPGELLEILRTVAYALLIALVLRIFLFQPFTIPSSSMRPNLMIGDYVVVSKFSYGYSKHSIPFSPGLFSGRLFAATPERGDVIVFKTPAEGGKDLIKRLIGLPGDTVQVTWSDGGISLTLQAKALGNAAVGQSFNLQNPASKKVIEAVATGPGQAVTGPEAQRLKAAGSTQYSAR